MALASSPRKPSWGQLAFYRQKVRRMINYGYFRHRFDAHKNRKLNALADEIGIEAYAYYYLLLELYGSVIASTESKDSALIHQRVVANTWRKRVDSAHLVLTKLQLSGLLVFTKLDATYEISIPNFLNYFGSYSKTDRQNVANKIKENKSKINKNKEKEIKVKTFPESTSVRAAYVKSYEMRYGIKPIIAAKENVLIKRLIASVGLMESEKIAGDYPFYNDPWHIKQKHPLGLLVAQLDKVRVELANPERMLDEKRATRELSDYELKKNNLAALGLE